MSPVIALVVGLLLALPAWAQGNDSITSSSPGRGDVANGPGTDVGAIASGQERRPAGAEQSDGQTAQQGAGDEAGCRRFSDARQRRNCLDGGRPEQQPSSGGSKP